MLPTDLYVVAKINNIMKKYTLLFATLLAMSGMAFGQKEAKLLWEKEVDYLLIDGRNSDGIPNTILETTPSGKTIVDIISSFTGTLAGSRVYDLLGKDISSSKGLTSFNLIKGKDISWITTKDSLFIFDKELSLIKGRRLDIAGFSFQVEDGLIFYLNNDVIKYSLSGEKIWQYTSKEKIISVPNKKVTVFKLEDNIFLYLDSYGKEKMRIPSKGNNGLGYRGSDINVLKSVDLGFWLVGSKEIYKYDSTGIQTGYTDFNKEKIDSDPFVTYNGSVMTKNNFIYEGYSSNSIVLAHQKQDSIRFIKIDKFGKYQISAFKDGRQIGDYNPSAYLIDDEKVMFSLNLKSEIQYIGFCNFKIPSQNWIKQLPNSEQFPEYVDNTFVVKNNKSKESTTGRDIYSSITLYDSTGKIKLSFKEDSIYRFIKKNDYIYIEHGAFFSKIKPSEANLIWKKSKPISSNYRYHSFLGDSEGNDYWIYSKGSGIETKIDFISKLTSKSSLFFSYSKSYVPERSNILIDNKNQILITITHGENVISGTHTIRKYSTRCLNDLNPISITGKTEACPTEKVKLSTQKQDDLTYQWQKDGKDIPNVKDVVYDFGESGTYTVIAKDELCQNSVTSNALKVNIRTLPSAEVTAPKSIFCEGDKTVMTATTNGTFFQWQKDQKDIANATSGIYEVSEAGNYRVGVRDDKCPQVGFSNTYTIITKLLPEANISTDIKGVVYEPFTVKMTANSGTGLAYQWLKDDAIIPNETKATYEAQKSGKYKVNVTYDGCTKLSDALTISILIPLANQEDVVEEQVQVYPNPSKGEFKIILPKSLKSADIQLFDTFGRERSLMYVGEQAQAEGLVQGVYFLRIQKGERSVTNKIIIE